MRRPFRDSLRAAVARGERVAVIDPFMDLPDPVRMALSLATALTEREERMAPERWQPLLDLLAATGHIGRAERDRILGGLSSGEAVDLGGVLGRIPRVLLVRSDLPDDPADAARAFADTLTARPAATGVATVRLDALALAVETRPGYEWSEGSVRWTLVATACADGRRYAAVSDGVTFGPTGPSDMRSPRGEPGVADAATAVLELVNKVLRDRGLPHRVYVATPAQDELEEPDFDAILAAPEAWAEPPVPLVAALLTPREAAVYNGWASGGRNGALSFHLPDPYEEVRQHVTDEPRFTTDRVAADVALLGRLGLVTDSARAAGQRRLARVYVQAPVQIFGAFGLGWSTDSLGVDTEYESPFGALVQALAGISRGAFAPTDVEPYDRGQVAFAFTLGGRRFAASLQTWETGFDDGFLGLVNCALVETGADGRFLDLEPQTDESATYLFLTSAQEQALVEAGLVDRSE